VIARARILALALLAGQAVPWAVAHVIDTGSTFRALVGPAVLAGLVAPVVGYRVYLKIGSALPPDATRDAAAVAYVRAILISLAITEATSLLCAVAYLLSGDRMTYVGPAMHVILTGAIWPREERFESFAGAAADRRSA
jgi:hypothetical protein